MPSYGQLGLLLAAIALFAIGGGISLCRLWKESERLRIAAKACMYWGLMASLGVLTWHAVSRAQWIPLDDNFGALIWLGTLLAGFVLYVQYRRPLPGLDWFLMPVVVVLLVTAMIFGSTRHQNYDLRGVWEGVHSASAYGGAAAFAVAGAMGAMYLLATRRLRSHASPIGPAMGSLERLEHLAFASVTLGFALLTVGLITGVAIIFHRHGNTKLGPEWFLSPKVVLTVCVWLVYAVVLHAPMNPVLRGRKAAMLSVVGLVLMIGTLVAVQYM